MAGDVLSIFLFLLAAVISFGIGGFTTNGWRSSTLWVLTAVMALAAIWWLFKPDMAPWISALFHSGALIILFTVGIVALMVTGRRAGAKSKWRGRARTTATHRQWWARGGP